MRSHDSERTLFTLGYRDKLEQQYPCYGGLLWAMRTIERPHGDALKGLPKVQQTHEWSLRAEALQVFEELYTLALAELAKEALDQIRDSIQATGDRGSWHGRLDEEPKGPRERSFWCKREIQRIEEFRRKMKSDPESSGS